MGEAADDRGAFERSMGLTELPFVQRRPRAGRDPYTLIKRCRTAFSDPETPVLMGHRLRGDGN